MIYKRNVNTGRNAYNQWNISINIIIFKIYRSNNIYGNILTKLVKIGIFEEMILVLNILYVYKLL